MSKQEDLSNLELRGAVLSEATQMALNDIQSKNLKSGETGKEIDALMVDAMNRVLADSVSSSAHARGALLTKLGITNDEEASDFLNVIKKVKPGTIIVTNDTPIIKTVDGKVEEVQDYVLRLEKSLIYFSSALAKRKAEAMEEQPILYHIKKIFKKLLRRK